MFKPKTFQHLCNAFQMGTPIEINGVTGTIFSLKREDGSGYNFIVTINTVSRTNKGVFYTDVFVRVES